MAMGQLLEKLAYDECTIDYLFEKTGQSVEEYGEWIEKKMNEEMEARMSHLEDYTDRVRKTERSKGDVGKLKQ